MPVKATGTLTYDQYGNLTINARTTDPNAPVAAREVPRVSFKGRAVIDVVNHELKLMDVTGNVNPDEVLAPERRRRYVFEGDLLTSVVVRREERSHRGRNLAASEVRGDRMRARMRLAPAIAAAAAVLVAWCRRADPPTPLIPTSRSSTTRRSPFAGLDHLGVAPGRRGRRQARPDPRRRSETGRGANRAGDSARDGEALAARKLDAGRCGQGATCGSTTTRSWR